MINPQQRSLHSKTNGGGQVANKVGSALSLVRTLRAFPQGLGAPSKVIKGAPPSLLHLCQKRALLRPIFMGHAVAEGIGRDVAFVDQLLAFFARELWSHGFTSLAVTLRAGVARLPALPINLFAPRLLLGAQLGFLCSRFRILTGGGIRLTI